MNQIAKLDKNEVTISTGREIRPLIPTNMEEAWRMAQAIAVSGMAPKSYGTGNNLPSAVFTAMQMGAEVGLSPMSAVQNIAVINGKPGLYGPAQLAIVRNSGQLEHFKEFFDGSPYEDNYKAVCVIKRRDDDEYISEFSVDDAKKAGLWSKQGPWTQYPKRMLKYRARSFGLQDTFGDFLLGLSTTAEELLDSYGTPEKDVTPPRPQRPGTAQRVEDFDNGGPDEPDLGEEFSLDIFDTHGEVITCFEGYEKEEYQDFPFNECEKYLSQGNLTFEDFQTFSEHNADILAYIKEGNKAHMQALSDLCPKQKKEQDDTFPGDIPDAPVIEWPEGGRNAPKWRDDFLEALNAAPNEAYIDNLLKVNIEALNKLKNLFPTSYEKLAETAKTKRKELKQ